MGEFRRLSVSVVLTCMNKENLWSFFCLLLMSSSADGWLLQKVPTALFIFSSSSPLNWNKHTNTRNSRSYLYLLQLMFLPNSVNMNSGFPHLLKHQLSRPDSLKFNGIVLEIKKKLIKKRERGVNM